MCHSGMNPKYLSLAQSNGDVVRGEAGAQGTGQAGGEWVRGVEHDTPDLAGVGIIEDAPADRQHIADEAFDAVVRQGRVVRYQPGACPDEHIVCQAAQAHHHLLRRQPLLVAFGQPQPLLVALEGGLCRPPPRAS